MLIRFKSAALSFIDWINSKSDPYVDFKRPIELPPGTSIMGTKEGRLSELDSHYERQMAVVGHVRHGGRLFLHETPNDMGDLCIFQGIYTGTKVLEAAVYPTSEKIAARDRAVEGLRLYTQPHLVRGVSVMGASREFYIDDPTWDKFYFERNGYWIREDASVDSFSGWLFGMACAIKYGDPNDVKVRENIIAYGNLLGDDGYVLRNRDRRVTRYGKIKPGIFQAPSINLAMAGFYRMTEAAGQPNDRWKIIAKKYCKDFAKTETHWLGKRKWHNDHMAILFGLTYMMVSEDGDPGREEARAGLERLIKKNEKMGNAFLIHAARMVGISVPLRQIEIADQVLSEFSLSTTPPNGKMPVERINSGDIETVEYGNEKIARTPLPIWKRPAHEHFWQRNPFSVDDYIGHRSPHKTFNGFDFRVAYACRHLGLVESFRPDWTSPDR